MMAKAFEDGRASIAVLLRIIYAGMAAAGALNN